MVLRTRIVLNLLLIDVRSTTEVYYYGKLGRQQEKKTDTMASNYCTPLTMHDMYMQFLFLSDRTSPRYRGRSQPSWAFPLSPRQATLPYIPLLLVSAYRLKKRKSAVLPSLSLSLFHKVVIQRVACRSRGGFHKLSHTIQPKPRFSARLKCQM